MDGVMNIVIDRASQEDKPEIFKILKQVNMHYIPSEEMPEIAFDNYVVAKVGTKVVGFCGYKVLFAEVAKTELMAVDKHYRGKGIGFMLQAHRMEEMLRKGIKKVITNTDAPETIEWYKKNFGYKEVGRLKKYHEFANPLIDYWTTLECDLQQWVTSKKEKNEEIA
jgi:N-acetylglutamate synthase-like GNAT family acetyltransferase